MITLRPGLLVLILRPVVSAVYLLVDTPPRKVRALNAANKMGGDDPAIDISAELTTNEVPIGGTTKQIMSTCSPIQRGTSGRNVILLSRDTEHKYGYNCKRNIRYLETVFRE